MKKSSLASIVDLQQQSPISSLDSYLIVHIEQMLQDLTDFLNFYLEQQDTLLQETDGLRDAPENSPATYVDSTVFYDDDDQWRTHFTAIIDNKWTLKNNFINLSAYGLTLFGFYQRALRDKSIPIEQLAPLILVVEEKVRKLMYFGGRAVSLFDPISKNIKTKHAKQKTRKVTKLTEDWEWITKIIENLNNEKKYKTCATLTSAITTTRDEMVHLKREKKITAPVSGDTIRRCFKEVFNITTDTYSQPLKLQRKV